MTANAISKSTSNGTTSISFHVQSIRHFGGMQSVDTRLRQQLELALIHKWRSPFNQENWERWGQPFGRGKH